MYKTFTIPKKSGGVRIIEAPDSELKLRQRWIKENILEKLSCSNYAKGFRKGNSIVDNAVTHVGKELVISIDLQDFFPTIKYCDVYRLFKYIGYNNQVSHLLTKICTNQNNVLPQGSPASPYISNLVLLKLDKRLSSLAEKLQCSYTRYADDITFSGNKNRSSIINLVQSIIEDEGFTINKDKLRYEYWYQKQEVTGLVVNKKLSVPKSITNEIQNAIYYCKKYGVENHMQKIGCNKSFYKEHLYGIAYFIKMIDNNRGLQYINALNEINWPY